MNSQLISNKSNKISFNSFKNLKNNSITIIKVEKDDNKTLSDYTASIYVNFNTDNTTDMGFMFSDCSYIADSFTFSLPHAPVSFPHATPC